MEYNTFLQNQPHPEHSATACTVYRPGVCPIPALSNEPALLIAADEDQGVPRIWIVKQAQPRHVYCLHPDGSLQKCLEAAAPIRALSVSRFEDRLLLCVHADQIRIYQAQNDGEDFILFGQLSLQAQDARIFADNERLYLTYDGMIGCLTPDFCAVAEHPRPSKILAQPYKINQARYDRLYQEERMEPGRLGGVLIKADGKYLYFCCDALYRCGDENLDTFVCVADSLDGLWGEHPEQVFSRRYLLLPNGGVPSIYTGEDGQLYAAFIGATAYSAVPFKPAVARLEKAGDGFYRPDPAYIYESRPVDALRPLIDGLMIRDTFISLCDDGWYYLTGTTPCEEDGSFWGGTHSLYLWRSQDLIHFEALGKVYDYADHEGCWQGMVSGNWNCWAPEICYLHGTYWLTYSTAPGCGLLKSVSGKPDGPYQDMGRVVVRGIDSGFFLENGRWYLIWQNGRIAELNSAGTSFLEEPRLLLPVDGQQVGYEGAGLIKVRGKYVLYAAEWNGDYRIDGTYDMMYAISDKLEGPYCPRRVLAPHAGHGCLFYDKDGELCYTLFGNDRTAPFHRGVGIGRVDIQERDGDLFLSTK